jgi:hypothetical protein
VIWSLLQKIDFQLWRMIFLNNQVWKKLFYIIIAAICFIPFFYHLYPRAAVAGSRSYEEILTMLPTFIDYINVGSSNGGRLF